jgi:hypothetical protein
MISESICILRYTYTGCLVFGFSQGVWIKLAEDVAKLLVGSFSGKVKQL